MHACSDCVCALRLGLRVAAEAHRPFFRSCKPHVQDSYLGVRLSAGLASPNRRGGLRNAAEARVQAGLVRLRRTWILCCCFCCCGGCCYSAVMCCAALRCVALLGGRSGLDCFLLMFPSEHVRRGGIPLYA